MPDKITGKRVSKRSDFSKGRKYSLSTSTFAKTRAESSLRAKLKGTSAKRTGNRLPDLSGDWEEFKALSDEGVHRRALADPDAQPTTAEMWKNVRVVIPETKQLTSIRLDAEVLAWFKREGKGYQTRINAVLRTYMEAKSVKRPRV
jgi:uncharacterized protein (DUF4415 family)